MYLHIAHANGFPAAVYQPLAKRLQAEVFALPMVGHDPRFPIENEWDTLSAQLLAYIDQYAANEPIVLLGHSLGAILSFKLALSRPERVKGLIMLDPPLIYGASTWPVRMARAIGKIDSVTPAALSKRRRRQWNDQTQLLEYFHKKPFFAQLHVEVLNAWLAHGIVENANTFKLAFDVDREVDIFRTTPLYLNRLRGVLKVPSWLIYATDSDACRRHCVDPFAHRFGLQVQTTTGGHMFPLVHLDETAQLINRCLAELTGSS